MTSVMDASAGRIRIDPIDLACAARFVPSSIRTFFEEHPRVALAYSGGCDSVFLLACALACGAEAHPFVVKTAFQYAFETDDARLAAFQIGVEPEVLALDIFAHPEVVANPPDRCYYCKKAIFGAIRAAAQARGIEVIVDGTNSSDDPAHRPGFRAIAEYGIRSPLREAGLTKDRIRELSRAMGLLTADKPNYSCLATRVEAGRPLTSQLLESFVQEDWLDRENGSGHGTL